MPKKQTQYAAKLEALFRGETDLRWVRDPDYYKPSAGGRRTCLLSPEATAFLIDNICGRNSKTPTFIMVEPEGDIRHSGPPILNDWPQAVRVALNEGTYIYNARTKKCCRPVWAEQIEVRTFDNMTYEAVRMVADPKTYAEKLPKVNTRLFAQE